MTAMSNNLENLLLDHAAGITSLTSPADLYLACYTSACSDASPGTEVSGGSYVPTIVVWSAASGGSISNSAQVVFTNMPTCTVTDVALWRASSTASAGDYFFYTAITPVALTSGESLVFDVGDLVVSFA